MRQLRLVPDEKARTAKSRTKPQSGQARNERQRTEKKGLLQSFFHGKKPTLRAVVLSLVAVYSVVTLTVQMIRISNQKSKRAELETEQALLEAELESLGTEDEYVGSDAYIEKAAREKLGWVKEGEILFKDANETEIED